VFSFLGFVTHRLFLGVLLDFFHPVRVAHDLEVEAPIVVEACLPQITGFVVLLGVERWMVKIVGEECELFAKGLSNGGRSVLQGVEYAVGKADSHRLDRFKLFWRLPAGGASWR